jgi:hypothetical protein
MPGAAELLFSIGLLLATTIFWALVATRWRVAAGAAIALLGSLPLVLAALAGRFHIGAALIFLSALLLGIYAALRKHMSE